MAHSQDLSILQGSGSLITAAMECANSGWCGWGFPANPGSMIGTSALIVKQCSTCPTGAATPLRPAGFLFGVLLLLSSYL